MKKIIILLLPVLLWQCTDVKDWHDPEDSVAPGIVSNVRVENINGGAKLKYTLPADNDLLGVKAVFSFKDGEAREAFSSAFNDSILVEGAPDTDEYTVNLYVLDRSHNESAPVQASIKPLTPPVEVVRQSLRMNPTFGGIYINWENTSESDIAISMYKKDSIGEFVLYDTYYSKTSSGYFSFRGLESTEQDFRFEIRDKWRNYSTPLDTALTPLFEEEIIGRDQYSGADIWQRYGWPETSVYRGDCTSQAPEANYAFRNIHNGLPFNTSVYWGTGVGGNTLAQFISWPNTTDYVFPIYFTIDMGRKASYSRLKYWMRPRSPYFSAPIFTSFEIWATNAPKPIETVGNGSKEDNLKYWTQWTEVGGTDEWKNDWIKLTDYVLTFPSGIVTDASNAALLTDEDKAFVTAGFEIEIDPVYSDQPFRYIRFVLRENNTATSQIQLNQLKFWGAYADD
jgi:hypothetical protein